MTRRKSLVLCAAAAAAACTSGAFHTGRGEPLSESLVVVQVPVAAAPQSQNRTNLATPLDRYVDGSRIVRVDPNGGEPIVLTPEFAGACDPDVSFDGETIVFAGKRNARDSWQIWRMNADGSGKRQITEGPGRHVAPMFAGSRFYLDDPQPTPQIIFVSNAHDSNSFSLYGTDWEGATLHRITFNPYSDFSPAVLPTGRLVFTSWQRYGDRFEPDGIFALLAVNIDGTDLMPFYGNHELPRYRDMAAVSRLGDRVYFIESDRLSWLGGGALASVSWRRPLKSYHRMNSGEETTGVFHSPAPLPDGGLLVSYRPRGSDSPFVIYRLDPESGERIEKIFEQFGWHSIDTQVLAPRQQARGRSNWLRPGSTTGVFYSLNSYRTNLGEGGSRSVAPPGTIKHVRVIEGMPRRILGVAPVEEDGSFHIRVPAETPITFQLLDEDYVAIRTQRAWTWVMGNENRGCIGCHEDRELSPPNRMVDAITKAPVELVLPPERRRTVDFRNQIAPILASRCATAGCHVGDHAGLKLGESGAVMANSGLRAVYESLLAHAEERPAGQYVVPGRAKDSPLIQLLLGRGISSRSPSSTPHDVLEQRELIQFIEWVDLGAEWESPPADDGRMF